MLANVTFSNKYTPWPEILYLLPEIHIFLLYNLQNFKNVARGPSYIHIVILLHDQRNQKLKYDQENQNVVELDCLAKSSKKVIRNIFSTEFS